MINRKKQKKIKKIFGIVSGLILASAALVGIALPAYYVSKNITLANDFAEGRSIQLNYDLVDANNNYIQDIEKEEQMLQESTNYLIQKLEDKYLTNISVTYGFQYREVPFANVFSLTSVNFNLASGLELDNIVSSTDNTLIDSKPIVDLIVKNQNIMFFNPENRVITADDIRLSNFEANFDDDSLTFRISIPASGPDSLDAINAQKITIYGFNNNPGIPDLNPMVRLVDGSPRTVYRFGVLTASFENSNNSFNLRNDDSDSDDNQLYNDSQILNALSSTHRYQIEPVLSQYSSLPRTGRTDSNLFVKKTSENEYIPLPNEDYPIFVLNDKQNYLNEITPYKDEDGVESTTKVQLDYNETFNSGAFVQDRNNYQKIIEENNTGSSSDSETEVRLFSSPMNELAHSYTFSDFNDFIATYEESEGDTSEEEPSEPVVKPEEQYQTSATWILWNDKEGLINYLNRLIISWYFNMYANIPFIEKNGVIEPNLTKELKKDGSNLEDVLFNTDEWSYQNYMNTDVRNNINNYVSTLTTIEKQFMSYMAYNANWKPEPITANELIPTLFDFNQAALTATGSEPLSPTDHSSSEISGWAWIESDAPDSAVKTLLGDYLIGFIDYKNYEDYFVNPNPPDTEDENYKETDPIDPFYNKFITLPSNSSSAKDFAKFLMDNHYQLPIVSLFDTDYFETRWDIFEREFYDQGIKYIKEQPIKEPDESNEEFKKRRDEWLKNFNNECAEIANKFLKPSLLFGQQNFTKPKIDNSFIGLPPLTVLFIIISSIIFCVGIFVSIRYRIPGFMSFLMAGLTYVLSLYLYIKFGFVFSFFSLISSALSAFLAFMTSFFLFNNFKKEIAEDSSVTGAIVKSIKKYWRTALDVHVMLLFSALAFLFFGEINNINFGAMLIISVFLSVILSGVIYYLLILLFTIFFEMNSERFFLRQKEYQKLIKMTGNNTKKQRNSFNKFLFNFFVNINYFSKSNYIIIGVFTLIGVVGTILLAVLGPISSLDFTSSNIFIVNNFDSLGLSQQQIMNILGVSSTTSYLYDNQFIIYSNNILDADSVLDRIIAAGNNTSGDNIKLIDNISSNLLSSAINIRLVLNSLKCFGIGIAFSAVWSLVSLNFVSILPIALSQGSIVLIVAGTVGITRMPFNINGVTIIMFIYVMSTVIAVGMISSIKRSWNRKIQINSKDLKSLVNSILFKIHKNFITIELLVLLFATLSLIFVSPTLIFTFLVMIIGVVLIMVLVGRIQVLSWYWFIMLFNRFTKEITFKEKPAKQFMYDTVNEQKIVGLNC